MKKSFGRESKEYTDEPRADEVGHGMKKGGHAEHKKHMMGGGAMGAPMNPMMAKRAMMARQMPMVGGAPTMRKKGGKAEGGESKAHEKAEMHEMKKIEKELKHHESMKASKAHHGLKHGGKAHMAKGGSSPAPKTGPAEMGGLLSGLEATREDKTRMTGGVRSPGYKKGGDVHHMSGHPEGSMAHHRAMVKHFEKKCAEGGSAHDHKMMQHHMKCCEGGKMMHKATGGLAAKGDSFQARSAMKPKIDVQDKVHEAKQGYAKQTKTMGVEGKGYKHGGKPEHKFAKGGTVSQSVAKRYLNDMNDGEKMPTKKGGTGDIDKKLDAYKHGGHVSHEHKMHHTTHGHDEHGHKAMHKHAKEHHGHEKMEAHPMKHGGHAKHHTTKMSTHKKAGGKCNY
jgi:hypothetical protein